MVTVMNRRDYLQNKTGELIVLTEDKDGELVVAPGQETTQADLDGVNPPDVEIFLIERIRKGMVVTLWQFRKAINVTGKRPSVNAYLAQASQDERDGWEVATGVERLHPNIDGLKEHFNMTDEDMDNLFILARSL